MNKKFLEIITIISILSNIGAIFIVGLVIHGLALGRLTLWEMVLNIGPVAIPLLVLSYFECRLFKNVNNESITIKDEILLWIAGVLRLVPLCTAPIGFLNLVSAYMIRKERKAL